MKIIILLLLIGMKTSLTNAAYTNNQININNITQEIKNLEDQCNQTEDLEFKKNLEKKKNNLINDLSKLIISDAKQENELQEPQQNVITTLEESLNCDTKHSISSIAFRFNTIKSDLETINTVIFVKELWNKQQRLDFDFLTTSIHHKQREITQKISCYADQKNAPSLLLKDIHNNLYRLEQYTNGLKNIFLKLELLTLDKKIFSEFLFIPSCNKTEYQKIALNIYESLTQWLIHEENQYIDSNIDELTNEILTQATSKIIIKNFISKKTYWQNLFHSKNKLIHNVLLINFFENYPSFANAYLDYKYLRITSNNSDQLLLHIDDMLKKQVISCSFSETELTINTLFKKNLLLEKQKIEFSNKLTTLANNNSETFELFIQHNSVIHSNNFFSIKKILEEQDPGLIENYLILMNKFFTIQKPYHPHFAYQLTKVSTRFNLLGNRIDKGLINKWLFKPSETNHLLEEIITIIACAREHVTQTFTKKQTNFFSTLFSGNWLHNNNIIKNITQGSNGIFTINFVNEILKNKNFTDIKTTSLYALAYAAPTILYKFLGYLNLIPYNESETLQNTETHKKLLDYLESNKNLAKNITEKDPESMNLIEKYLLTITKKENT